MKTIYTYHFNNNGTFTCTFESNEKRFSLNERKALESLQLLDTIPFDKIQVFKHSIRLYKENSEIHLRDLDLFVENKLDQYIPTLYQKIEMALREYRRKEAKKKSKKNKTNKNIFKVTISATLMATLLSSMSLKTKSEELSEPFAIEAISLNQEDLLEEKNSIAISKENVTNLETENIPEKTKQTEVITTDNTPNKEDGEIVYLNYKKTDDLVKKEHTFNSYAELANWCGEKWGISPNLILMDTTQESAGKEENLMQIEWEQWAGKPIRAYNFRDSKYETFLLTNNPTEEEKTKYTCVTQEDLKNPKTNMSIGCVLLRKSAEYMNYHIMATLQCYNLGFGNMDKIFARIQEETGQSKEEILSDQTNLIFYEYTSILGQGDPNYLSNVFQFIDEYGDTITFKHLQNGEVVEEKIHVHNDEHIL